jgi:hypothetical protein
MNRRTSGWTFLGATLWGAGLLVLAWPFATGQMTRLRSFRTPVAGVGFSLMVLACGAFAFATYYAAVHERRERQGRCVRCGYDLRSTPEQCPECGHPS